MARPEVHLAWSLYPTKPALWILSGFIENCPRTEYCTLSLGTGMESKNISPFQNCCLSSGATTLLLHHALPHSTCCHTGSAAAALQDMLVRRVCSILLHAERHRHFKSRPYSSLLSTCCSQVTSRFAVLSGKQEENKAVRGRSGKYVKKVCNILRCVLQHPVMCSSGNF